MCIRDRSHVSNSILESTEIGLERSLTSPFTLTANTLRANPSEIDLAISMPVAVSYTHLDVYKRQLIGKEILDYHDILIFGPNDAKTELYNHLKADSNFEDANIELKNAGKLSDVQERAVIKAHFK